MKSDGKSELLLLAIAVGLYCVSCSQEADEGNASGNPPLAIEPRVACGKVHAGMRTEDVLKQLGEPQRCTANALEYTRLGFAVMPGQDGIVRVVMCGDVTGLNGPLVNAFTGRTKEGIGLKSKREDLIKAYGEPSSSEKLIGGTESIRYDSLGITFTLEAGKIYHMIVRLQPAPESLPTVTLEPAPPATAK